jgi:hypothetical protein
MDLMIHKRFTLNNIKEGENKWLEICELSLKY